MRGHFLPRGQYTPECRKGLGQDVSSANEIGIALVIAGDTTYIPHPDRAISMGQWALGGRASSLERRRRSILRATEGFSIAPASMDQQIV